MMPRLTDLEEWFTAYKKGDVRSFKLLFDVYNKRLLHYAEQVLKDKMDAEDIVSDTFQKAWEKREEMLNLKHFSGFIFLTNRNSCFTHLKQDKRNQHTHREASYVQGETEESIEHEIIKNEVLGEIYHRIEKLPRKCRTIFVLTMLKGLSTKEVADQLGISERNVLNQKNRAIHLIRTDLYLQALVLLYITEFIYL